MTLVSCTFRSSSHPSVLLRSRTISATSWTGIVDQRSGNSSYTRGDLTNPGHEHPNHKSFRDFCGADSVSVQVLVAPKWAESLASGEMCGHAATTALSFCNQPHGGTCIDFHLPVPSCTPTRTPTHTEVYLHIKALDLKHLSCTQIWCTVAFMWLQPHSLFIALLR